MLTARLNLGLAGLFLVNLVLLAIGVESLPI
jgi:hypothetical protein